MLPESFEKAAVRHRLPAATGYGRTVTARIAAELTALAWNVVAASAYGVAASAHKAALAAPGSPVAVLAAGIDVAHPPGQSGLLDAIATSGLLVSEFPPGTSVIRARRRARLACWPRCRGQC